MVQLGLIVLGACVGLAACVFWCCLPRDFVVSCWAGSVGACYDSTIGPYTNYLLAFHATHSYTRFWKSWDALVYFSNACTFVAAVVGISFGVYCMVGRFGALLNTNLAEAVVVVSGCMLALAAVAYDATRFYMPGWFLAYMCFMLLLLVSSSFAFMLNFSREEATSRQREAWIILSSETRNHFQADFKCCGWEFYQDNSQLPCSSTPERGCQEQLSAEVELELTVLEWMMYAMLVVQLVAVVVALPFACQLYSHISFYTEARAGCRSNLRDAEIEALLEESKKLRGSIGKGQGRTAQVEGIGRAGALRA